MVLVSSCVVLHFLALWFHHFRQICLCCLDGAGLFMFCFAFYCFVVSSFLLCFIAAFVESKPEPNE
ncbi:hypothetical protein NC653_008881 [Populus alba x Populus x berolinensis]|uniref:Uncharacterized protein n=1 Tax=Populus alba x Populus x berolinensis TaxID=444605 RepID=A0AAD6R7I8_9ROSI|nr:hypothetical protein NC653_008881 [Populus alba x Populus x berolinensis]